MNYVEAAVRAFALCRSFSVSTANSTGDPTGGYYTTLSLSYVIPSRTAAHLRSFMASSGQNYVVSVADFGGRTCTNWRVGSAGYPCGGSHSVVVPEGATAMTISLTVYSP